MVLCFYNKYVSSAIPQVWILQLILVNIFTNQMDGGTKSTLSKFLDNTKLRGWWLINQMIVLPFRGIFTSWRNEWSGKKWIQSHLPEEE